MRRNLSHGKTIVGKSIAGEPIADHVRAADTAGESRLPWQVAALVIAVLAGSAWLGIAGLVLWLLPR